MAENKQPLISLAQVEYGYEIRNKVNELFNKALQLDTESYRKKIDKVQEFDLSIDVRNKLNREGSFDDSYIKQQITALNSLIQSKADKDDLSKYRRKDSPISLVDLDADLVKRINEKPTGSGYDDTELRGYIDILNQTKAATADLIQYRRKDVLVQLGDLSDEIKQKLVPFNDSVIQQTLANLTNTNIDQDALLGALDRNKADKAEFANYRPNTISIMESDLDVSVINKLNALSTGYNDSELRERIVMVEQDVSVIDNKLVNYRNKTVKIAEADLEQTVVDKLNSSKSYDDTQVKSDIDGLKTGKADKTQLDSYRQTSVKIAESDLTQAVIDKLNSSGGGSGPAYDDTQIKADIAALKSGKADVTALATYRLSTAKVLESELDSALATKINGKADASILSNYRLLTAKVLESELDSALTTKISGKADASVLVNYRPTATKITESDLDTALTTKIGGKADTSALANYRPTSVKIGQSDLDNTLTTKIDGKVDSTQLNNYRLLTAKVLESELDTALATKISGKADASALGNYRPTNVKIIQTDLDTALTTKIDGKADSTQLSNYRLLTAKVLETELDSTLATKINNKVDGTTLAGYRQNAVKISESDLDASVKTKLNDTVTKHGDLTGLNADNNYLHVTSTEKSKYDGYDAIIKNLQTTLTAALDRINTLEEQLAGSKPDSEPAVETSSLHNQTDVPINTTDIRFVITGDKALSIADASKITSVPSGILGTPRIDGNTLVVPFNSVLPKTTDITVTVGIGAIKNGTAENKTAIIAEFITDDGSAKKILWSYDFTVPMSVANWQLSKDSNWTAKGITITDEDVYGPVLDGDNAKVELLYLGAETGTKQEPGVTMPRDYFDSFASPAPHGKWSYDSGSTVVSFTSKAMSSFYFRLVKYK